MPLVLGMALSSAAQIITTQDRQPHSARELRGDPEPVHVSDLALNGEQFQKRNVRVKGALWQVTNTSYFTLEDEGHRILLIPMPELIEPMTRFPSERVEIVGYVRILPRTQQVLPVCGLESHCDDPDLPALPNERIDWPKVSVTVFDFHDASPLDFKGRGPGALSLSDVVANATSHRGKKVRVVGRFRGRNLFGDLPRSSQRDGSDWVLQDEAQSVWVTGRAPRGNGWSLDPMDRNDTLRWLVVEGKLEVVSDVAYLRASKVELASANRTASEADPPR
jgi:hypothetical protein